MNKKSKKILNITFIFYILLMIWLLFGQRMGRELYGSYWDVLSSNINLTPFSTIKLFIRAIIGSDYEYTVRHSVINLAGNVIMFIPLGFFIPFVLKNSSSFIQSIIICSIIIILIETVQLFTLLGSFDIDDFILNLAGSIIGYIIYSGGKRKWQN